MQNRKIQIYPQIIRSHKIDKFYWLKNEIIKGNIIF